MLIEKQQTQTNTFGFEREIWLRVILGCVSFAVITAVSGVVVMWRIERNPSGLVTIPADYCRLANNIVLSAA